MRTTSSTESDVPALPAAPTDWIVLLLPTVIGIRAFSIPACLLALGFLAFFAFMRRTQLRQPLNVGPLVLLVAAAAMVLVRSEHKAHIVFLVLVTVLVLRLVITVDARTIISSLVDGAGLYLALNVLAHFAGLQSPNAAARIGGVVQSSGFVRTIFPFSSALDAAPSIASVYVAAVAFLIFEKGRLRLTFRLLCFAAALVVAWEAGARTALFTAVALPIAVATLPLITRWLAQALTIFASVSAILLPGVVSAVQFAAVPFLSLIAPFRDTRSGDVTSLNSRDSIWSGSLNYWTNYVDGMHDRILGFGQNGQFRSGASWTYAKSLSWTVRDPEMATMHNSFLQQLFDGGLLGWSLMTLSILWASVYLARRRTAWGRQGVAAIVVLAGLLINAMTQVSIAPGPSQEGFWMLLIVVAVSCQSLTSTGYGESGSSPTIPRQSKTPKEMPSIRAVQAAAQSQAGDAGESRT